ncbi:hypothetical protein RND81_01G076900 [Saponaria officinalis]|uniref:Protein farnesyltransferase subunit beta n=1 Tax=Saponaria officinalis TaxID=3572 RepID=A0AAW1N665_SAPOF
MNSSSSETAEMTATITQREQCLVESHVFSIFHHFSQLPKRAQSVMLEIARDSHAEYLINGLRRLPASFCVLDANRPWLCYWILHSLALLNESIDDVLENNVVDFLSKCQDPHGGYGGGPGQMPHLATTYAAVNSLVTLGGNKALSSIHRDTLYTFLLRMKDPNGSFRMHEKGETDVRACYTAIAVASILNILDHKLVENVGNFIVSCQTYEGGIGGEPGSEGHGGYTFCGLATMVLINEAHRLDLHALINWAVFRQGVEGGFQGRTNKLVDGCYSFWQGGVFPLIQRLQPFLDAQLDRICTGMKEMSTGDQVDLSERDHVLPEAASVVNRIQLEQEGMPCTPIANLSDIGFSFVKQSVDAGLLFHNFALQQYIILCSQVVDGGFRDKPGKSRDFYHTCYCLSGLSVCQFKGDADDLPSTHDVLGPYSNLLEPTHPLYNVVVERYDEAREFFANP